MANLSGFVYAKIILNNTEQSNVNQKSNSSEVYVTMCFSISVPQRQTPGQQSLYTITLH